MISAIRRAFASSGRTVDSVTSRASWAPSAVAGPLGPLGASATAGRKCDGFVLVTSRNLDDVSARRPDPWQLGQDAVLRPSAFPIRPSPPHKRQTSPSIESPLRDQVRTTCSTDPPRAPERSGRSVPDGVRRVSARRCTSSGGRGACRPPELRREPQACFDREHVSAVVLDVRGVPAHPAPLHDVKFPQLQQAPPEILVLYRLLLGGEPPVPLPTIEPSLVKGIMDVSRVGRDLHEASLLQRLQTAD